jgi:hypothetical protein
VTKLDVMSLGVGDATCRGGMENVCSVIVGNPEGKRPLGVAVSNRSIILN